MSGWEPSPARTAPCTDHAGRPRACLASEAELRENTARPVGSQYDQQDGTKAG